MENNIFEYATRNKIRFASSRGELTTEQLWDIPLQSKDGFDLDTIAKNVSRTLKGMTEESFVRCERTPAIEKAETALAIVKHIIGVKLTEEDAAKKRAANKAERAKLLAILAEKQADKLSSLSEEALQKRINELEV